MKKVLIGLGVLVVIIAVGVYVFLGSLNDIVRAAVEKVGSDMTQTNVSLNEVDIELTSGKGACADLVSQTQRVSVMTTRSSSTKCPLFSISLLSAVIRLSSRKSLFRDQLSSMNLATTVAATSTS